jgi:MoaA/NifB/PqqE/SkfB family radical SAM enzyme
MKPKLQRLPRQLAALKYGLVFRKPWFMARMVKFYLKSFAFPVEQPLRYVDFAVDYRCNLACQHCFKTALENNDRRPQLQAADYRRIARQCRELGAIHLSLQGGEVTMLDNLEELIRSMSPGKTLFSLTTNGTLIDAKKARQLRSWGVDQLNVSLDSFIPEEHDEFRGQRGCFNKSLSGIGEAKKHGLKVQINTTVSKMNLYTPGFLKMADYCISHRILLNLVLAAPSGNWDGNETVMLDKNDMKYIRGLVKSTPWIRQDMDSIQLDRGCPAMKEAIYITPFGDVLCCPFIHISFGNLHDESLQTIRKRALGYNFLGEHAKQCLVAEDRGFVGSYLSKTFGRKDLPADCVEIFGRPESAEYPLPGPSVAPDEDPHAAVSEWRRLVDSHRP